MFSSHDPLTIAITHAAMPEPRFSLRDEPITLPRRARTPKLLKDREKAKAARKARKISRKHK